jgi:hypothetical protein
VRLDSQQGVKVSFFRKEGEFLTDSYSDDPVDYEAGNGESIKSKFSGLLAFVLLLVGGTYFVQTTLAANINLNSGAPFEFGQGITQTIACDSNGITLLPQAEFVNASGSGSYVIKSLVVSEVDSSSNGCQDKTLTFKGFGNTSSTALDLVNSVSSIVVIVSSGSPNFSIPATTGVTLTDISSSGFTISFDPTASPISINDVFKFTVESSVAATGTSLVVSRSSVGTTADVAFTTQPQITIKDANSNTVTTSNAVVTATISSGGTLVGTKTATAISGVATFSNLGIRGFGGTAYTISYSVSGLVPATQTVTPTAYTLGATGPGGGKIFYIASSAGFTCGATLNEKCYYLEAAPPALGLASLDSDTGNSPNRTWAQNSPNNYTSTTVIGSGGETSTATSFGWGYRNTLAIISQGNTDPATSAAALAQSYSGGGRSDWFLPSLDELTQMCTWQAGACYGQPTSNNVGTGAAGFIAGVYYVSSTELTASTVWGMRMQQGGRSGGSLAKNVAYIVRPARAF